MESNQHGILYVKKKSMFMFVRFISCIKIDQRLYQQTFKMSLSVSNSKTGKCTITLVFTPCILWYELSDLFGEIVYVFKNR